MPTEQMNGTCSSHNIMIVDDDESILDSLSTLLRNEHWDVTCAKSGNEALRNLESHTMSIVLTDIVMPGIDGFTLVGRIKKCQPDVEIIIMTGNSSEDNVIRALKAGAFDYFRKPIKGNEVLSALTRTNFFQEEMIKHSGRNNQNQRVIAGAGTPTFIGNSEGTLSLMRQLEKIATRAAPDATVLLKGESGVGKEVTARMLHHMTKKERSPFEALNCGGISEGLLERELFGHERGSFTGAEKRSPGVFEMGLEGTVLLDEVTEMSLQGQSRFLRVLETRSFRRIGGSSDISLANTRIIATTNKDIERLVKEGKFREDLYYRLDVIPVAIPPLRERREDIITLANYFLRTLPNDHSLGFSQDACDMLYTYDYPGNIRELRNIVASAAVFRTGNTIRGADLLFSRLLPDRRAEEGRKRETAVSLTGFDLEKNEIHLINRAIKACPNNLTSVAKLLGISPQALYRRFKKYNIPYKDSYLRDSGMAVEDMQFDFSED